MSGHRAVTPSCLTLPPPRQALQSFALRVYDKELGPSLKQLRDAYVDGEFEVMDPMFQQVVMQKAW